MAVETSIDTKTAQLLQEAAAKWLSNPPPSCQSPKALNRLQALAWKELEAVARPRLHAWAEEVKHDGVGILHKVPVAQDLRRTPIYSGAADKLTLAEDLFIGAIASMFGEPGTLEGKIVERVVHNVFPTIEDGGSQLAASQEPLSWHVEDGFHPHRADWLFLLCLRGDENVQTRYARSKDLRIDDATSKALFSTKYGLKVDHSFSEPYFDKTFPTCVLSSCPDGVEVIFDPEYTLELQRNTLPMLATLKDELDRVGEAVTLMDGDLLVINNRKVMHSRGPARARFDGTDRWLKRTLAWSDPSRMTMFTTDRVLRFPDLNDK